MSLSAGSVTVTSVVSISGSGLAWELFQQRRTQLDDVLDDADAAAAAMPRQVDQAAVSAFIAEDPATNAAIIDGYGYNPVEAPPWTEDLLIPLPDPIDRLEAYRALAVQCEAEATALIPYLTGHAVINPGTFAAGGDPVTGTGTLS